LRVEISGINQRPEDRVPSWLSGIGARKIRIEMAKWSSSQSFAPSQVRRTRPFRVGLQVESVASNAQTNTLNSVAPKLSKLELPRESWRVGANINNDSISPALANLICLCRPARLEGGPRWRCEPLLIAPSWTPAQIPPLFNEACRPS